MVRLFPQAEIIALDIGNDRPSPDDWEPHDPRHRIEWRSGVDFTTNFWGVEELEGTFDFVHAGMLCGSVPDWLAFYRKVFR